MSKEQPKLGEGDVVDSGYDALKAKSIGGGNLATSGEGVKKVVENLWELVSGVTGKK